MTPAPRGSSFTLMGYDAETAGLALSIGGVVLLVELPIVGQLTGRLRLAS